MSTTKCDAARQPARKPAGGARQWISRIRQWFRGEFDSASLAYIRGKAAKGDPRCEYRLGLIYESGRHGFQSDAEAFKWFLRAAYQGVAEAQAKVAHYRQCGRGVSRDASEAFTWYRKAAEQGHLEAQAQLARLYREGEGVSPSVSEATKWHRRALAHGWTEVEQQAA